MLKNKIKEIFNKDNIKKILILGLLVFAVVFILVFMIKKFNSDGMEQTKGVNVYYRTYTKEKGWSRWSKNGVTSGNEKDDILNIQIKAKPKRKGEVTYNVFNKEWTGNVTTLKNKKIKGIKVGTTGKIETRYDVCYRTYNKENKWLEWSCDGQTNGNKKEAIKAIEIKLIPKNVIKKEYLKDFEKTSKSTEVGF